MGTGLEEKVGSDVRLRIYMIDHGAVDREHCRRRGRTPTMEPEEEEV